MPRRLRPTRRQPTPLQTRRHPRFPWRSARVRRALGAAAPRAGPDASVHANRGPRAPQPSPPQLKPIAAFLKSRLTPPPRIHSPPTGATGGGGSGAGLHAGGGGQVSHLRAARKRLCHRHPARVCQGWALSDISRHVIGCRLPHSFRVRHALDDVMATTSASSGALLTLAGAGLKCVVPSS